MALYREHGKSKGLAMFPAEQSVRMTKELMETYASMAEFRGHVSLDYFFPVWKSLQFFTKNPVTLFGQIAFVLVALVVGYCGSHPTCQLLLPITFSR
jgi:hypothetical protein